LRGEAVRFRPRFASGDRSRHLPPRRRSPPIRLPSPWPGPARRGRAPHPARRGRKQGNLSAPRSGAKPIVERVKEAAWRELA